MATRTRTGDAVGGLRWLVRKVVRALVLLALAATAGVGALALAFARGGFSEPEILVSVLLLAAPAVVLAFAAGVRELAELPGRLLGLPGRGGAHLAELTSIAGAARAGSWRRLPRLLWRTRGLVSSTRDLVGVALPLRVLTPPFLALTAGAIAASAVLVGAGLIALVGLVVS